MRACHTGAAHECPQCGLQFEAAERLHAHEREHPSSRGDEPQPGRLRLP